eukprot:CAMPEP_0115249146 /NCGR_PEP_ID=MMETSP0270-20121206/42440_1 /TAXON_ID=71861 /ORGANISM="Scrippsiella trochoidea, Strain CCMP3099" /LENGTH=125 /DNA_ID=CAMNT_0002664479 /DNA_START=495 /DNA_END=872 /DNA_ORIENTATION=-
MAHTAIFGDNPASVVVERICVHSTGYGSSVMDLGHHCLRSRDRAVVRDRHVGEALQACAKASIRWERAASARVVHICALQLALGCQRRADARLVEVRLILRRKLGACHVGGASLVGNPSAWSDHA